MQIYITKNAQQIGPFSEEEIRAKLKCGEAKTADLAWSEGCSDWVPLSEFLPSVPESIQLKTTGDSPEISSPADKQQIQDVTIEKRVDPPPLPSRPQDNSVQSSAQKLSGTLDEEKSGNQKIGSTLHDASGNSQTDMAVTSAQPEVNNLRGNSEQVWPKDVPLVSNMPGTNTSAASRQVKFHHTYRILGICFGMFGLHNFYAGYTVRATIQLLVTLLSFLLLAPVSILWALVEVLAIKKDATGRKFV